MINNYNMNHAANLQSRLQNSDTFFLTHSFGLTPAEQLNVPSVVANQSVDVSLPLATTGPVQRMEPLTNLQVDKFKTKYKGPRALNRSPTTIIHVLFAHQLSPTYRLLSRTTLMSFILLALCRCMYSSPKMDKWRKKYSQLHGKTFLHKTRCNTLYKIVNVMQVRHAFNLLLA